MDFDILHATHETEPDTACGIMHDEVRGYYTDACCAGDLIDAASAMRLSPCAECIVILQSPGTDD
jgi:hypothetical protein